MPVTLRAFLISLAALALTACSQTPGAGAAEQVLNKELEDAHLEGLLAIEEVEKRNAYDDGESIHVVEVDYTLRAKKALGAYSDQVKGDESLSGMDRFAMVMALGALRMEHGDFQKGDTFNRQRTLRFRDTENGWQAMKE